MTSNKNRAAFVEEVKLRRFIQNSIRVVESKKRQKRSNESKLRNLVRKLIMEASVADKVPHEKTGINLLEDMLKKIIPVLETDYKIITTDASQRESFRNHIINAMQNAIAPPRVNQRAPEGVVYFDDEPEAAAPTQQALPAEPEAPPEDNVMQEAPTLSVDPNNEVDMPPEDEQKFIDVTTDGKAKASEEEEFGAGLEHMDTTGRNMAFATFKKIESPIVQTYDLIDSDEDRAIYYEYLLTNAKLYFDRFEKELQADLGEPTTNAYEAEMGRQATMNPEDPNVA